jgi:tetratricopeptide (TPR) repeat protein
MECYDCDLRDRFDIQDQIASEIVSSLQLALTEGEQAQLWRRGTESGKAWEEFQRGHDFERRYTREGHRQAIKHYRQALAIDPNYLSAVVSLAFCYLDEVRLGWVINSDKSVAEAEKLCDHAMAFPPHPDVQALLAFVRFFQNRWDEAAAAMDIAIELGTQSPETIGYQGALSDLMGDYSAAIRAYTRAMSLTTHSPAWIAANLGLSYLATGDNFEAEQIFREVIQHHPKYVRAWIGLAISLFREGKTGEATRAAEVILSLDPHFTTKDWALSRPFRHAPLLSRFIEDMQAVGLP